MNYYPENLKEIAAILEGINKVDAKKTSIYMESGIQLRDEDGTDWGKLIDEIGGAWSWVPPGGSA